MRPKMEGEGQQPTLVVERFIGIWPEETCGARFATEPLENTYWKLTRLGDAPVTVASSNRNLMSSSTRSLDASADRVAATIW